MILKSAITRDRMSSCPQMTYQVQDQNGNLSKKLPLHASAEFTYRHNILIRTDDIKHLDGALVNVNYVIGEQAKTLKEYLLHSVAAKELCMIEDEGWRVLPVYIDHEDLFIHHISDKLLDQIVIEDRIEDFTYTIAGEKFTTKVRVINTTSR